MQSFTLPRVEGYQISKIEQGKYKVAVNNGNIGAKVLNKAEYDQFMKQNKKDGKVKPSWAMMTVFGTLGTAAIAVTLDFALSKGKHVKQMAKSLGFRDLLDAIALYL